MNDKHYMNAEDIEIYKKAYEIAEMLKGATCSIAEETLEMALEIVKTGSVVTLGVAMNDKHYMNAEDIEIYKKAYEIAEMLKGATCSIAEETLEMALEIVKTGSVVTLNTERFVRNKKSVDTADSCESEHWEDYINPFPLD